MSFIRPILPSQTAIRRRLVPAAGVLFATLLFATLALAACGLKGDLYLPERETQPPAAEAERPAPEEDEARDGESADETNS